MTKHITKTQEELIISEAQVTAQNYAPLPIVLSKGEDIYVWDTDQKRYTDMMSAYSAVSFGHAHPRLIKRLSEQAKKLSLVSRAFHHDLLGNFLKSLCQLTGLDIALPMNTGAEAVETAIKAARRWGYQHKQIPENKANIIVANNNFHGRTTTIISFSSEPDYQKGFGPFTPGFTSIPFGNAEALRNSITPETCAFLVEPMQGEAGIIIPPAGWLKEVQMICKEHHILLILDEVQTGLGRTGKNFAFMHEIDKPDGVIIGKALGGGLLPVSAFVGTKELMNVFTPGSHGSTFGGNSLACAVGLEALALLQEEQLAEKSAVLGTYFIEQLHTIHSPIIRQIRGKGLWVGIDINPDYISAKQICIDLLKYGILTKDTHQTVIRLAPPLIITKDALDEVVSTFRHLILSYGL